ncbi:NACHT domain-containing protein [Lentzea kentuckyensis]|uniref:NACHT domain-containing protein n=1 Tax=Lentzea kentuckyensis TaxID=360086 RepID=UPI0013029EDB|nr:NACHT domain-containing protein [Lentzea kentuckyensis]
MREALETDDHLVITGGPGQGKSTLALRLAADLALSWSGQGTAPVTERVVPLRLPARELAARLDVPFAEALAASARAEYNVRLKCAIDPAHFEDRVSGCRWLLLVDGLDEVTSPADREDLVHALAGWAASGEVYRVVLTTRPIEGGALAPLQRIGAVRYELQPFDEDALRTFAFSWFEDSADTATNFLRQIRKAYLDELVRVPLLATIAAIIFEQRREHPLPDNQYELYEAYLRYLRTGHPHRPSPLDPHRDALLEHLGLVRVDADTSLLGAARTWAASRVSGDWQDDLVRFLTAVGPFTLRADDVQFLHHSFADHLAATARARLLPARFSAEDNDFAHLLHAARPREHGRHVRRVLLHYGRLHPPQADALLTTLNAGDSEQHLLAARLLAGHLPASPPVVSTFLATVRGWAMTTHYNAYEILAGASRATHHPGLSDWLADLMDDDRAPWTSRVEAAASLATRLRDRHEQAALARLHTAVSDLDGQTGHRLIAAEALSDCGESERAAAEETLRAILVDSFATPREHRDAALVMASLGGEARAVATSALLAALNDPEAPPARLVEAAHGLIEITVEHTDLCAESLARVLRVGPVWYGTGTLKAAAESLGSLGSRHVEMGIKALTSRITNVCLSRWERTATAGVLADIGPSHRALAVKHLLELSAEPALPQDLWRHGEMLRQCGWEYREHAVSVLRRVLSGAASDVNTIHWAARELREIGPDYRVEAVGHLIRLSEATAHRHVAHWERESALGELAATDELGRSHAVPELRSSLADERIDPKRRDQAAFELIELGPEYHVEVVGPLLQVVAQRFSLDAKLSAWRNLARLDTRFRADEAEVLTELMATSSEDDRTPPAGVWFSRNAFDDVQTAAGVLLRVIVDDTRDDRWRGCAVRNLISFGQPFHRAAVSGLIDLIRSEAVPRKYLGQWLREFTDVAEVFRIEVAQTLSEMALSADNTPAMMVNLAEAVQTMHRPCGPELIASLRSILVDDGTEPECRIRSAVLVASVHPELADEAVAAVLRDQRGRLCECRSELFVLARLGADPVPRLQALAADVNVRAGHRLRAISALRWLSRHEGTETLVKLADDEYVAHELRAGALDELAIHSNGEVPELIEYHQRVRDDRTQEVSDRCWSAYWMYRYDLTATSAAVELWRAVGANPELTVSERVSAVSLLRRTTYYATTAADFLAAVIAEDPTCGAVERKIALRCREGKGRLAGQRTMLSDRSIALEHRIPELENWSYQPLPSETEAAVRDVLSAPESTHRERVAAAAALAQLSSRFVGEAAELLAGLGWPGQEELAKLGPRWSSQVRANARATATDKTKPWRERWRAARLVWEGVEPRSDEQRMEWAEARGAIGVLRAMLTHTQPAIRWRAAKRLRDYDFADRVAGARVLEEIAKDPGARPALRWRAGEELTQFGARGRESGVAVLRNIMGDEGLPVMARVEAASVVGKIRPDLRAEVVRFLRQLSADGPLQQIKLCQAIGVFEPEEGARALCAMTNGGAPLTRIRAAEAMFGLRRDYRERAAITARNVLRDIKAPWHVRRRAACDLARWSDLCLEEARAALV